MTLKNNKLEVAELALIIGSACLPLIFTFPYRINLFLAWEGAYRLSIGQLPYQDFGTPVGYFFWILPALFFKVFGPNVFTLIIVQAFINIISNLIFFKILKLFNIKTGGRLIILLVYVLSFTLFNFWPWYNHLVFVLEIISFYLILSVIARQPPPYPYLRMALASIFVAFAFMTKQDTGGMGFIFGLCFLLYDFYHRRNFQFLVTYLLAYGITLAILIVPFLFYDFNYWFNYGQEPHFSRLTLFDLINEFLGASKYIKFYLLIWLFIIIFNLNKSGKVYLSSNRFYLSLLTLFILAQAAVIQVTSYTPVDGNIYFHSFAIALIVLELQPYFSFKNIPLLLVILCFTGLWWSNVYWTRFLRGKVQGILKRDAPSDVISKNTYILEQQDTIKKSRASWVLSDIPTFNRIKLPEPTIEGIKKIQSMPIVKDKGRLVKVLNMSELTQLAYILPYSLETGENFPLWYHKGVAFFDREVNLFCEKIEKKQYDLILFEDIRDLNNFYPYEVQNCIKEKYDLQFKFLAPRLPAFSYVEVYTLKEVN